MTSPPKHGSAEDFDLRQLFHGTGTRLRDRVADFNRELGAVRARGEALWLRCVGSAADREVEVVDASGAARRMLMFGSNNYLGLANHPRVRQAAREAVDRFGAGVGGPPLLNGYTTLHRELELRLAALKGAEDALIFSSGFGANLGLLGGLVGPGDAVLGDACSHASFWDGVRLARGRAVPFPHNDLGALERLLEQHAPRRGGDLFVGVEGVYSMDGDLAPLDRLVPLCAAHGALLLVDDAHGTGVTGPGGHGTAEQFGVRAPITVGTFSKTFAATGGFVAGERAVIDYLRFFARTYMFSASLPPPAVATVLAGLDVLESEPWLLARLRGNVAGAAARLRTVGFEVRPQAALIALPAPPPMDLRRAALGFHQRGVFVNQVEYPAVPRCAQRFRISVMATHTEDDLDRLAAAVAEVWREHAGGGR